MNILIINPFDKVPGENFRDQRYTILYKKLIESHNVTWLSSDFHHWSHSQRNKELLSDVDNKNIFLIKTIKYYRNISVKRFFSHLCYSVKVFSHLLTMRDKPDVILTIAPVENLFLTTVYSKLFDVPIVIDVLDLWPDLFIEAFPKNLRWFAKIALYPYHLMANYAYNNANHITSVSKTYTNVILKRVKKDKKIGSSYFYLGAPLIEKAISGVKSVDVLRCFFAGQFGYNYDIELILFAAKRCQREGEKIEFYLAGNGMKLDFAKKYIKDNELNNIFLLGWLSSEEMLDVASTCHVGLNVYTINATQSIPTKFFDYMSMGLYIVNSIAGEATDFLDDKSAGVNYEAGSLNSFYDVLIDVKKNINIAIEHGCSNRTLFVNDFNFDTIYDAMIEGVFKDVLC